MEVSGAEGFRQRPVWLLVVAALLIGQGWLTLRLFTPSLSIDALTNDEPVVSGRHALHYYHGMLGAKAQEEYGSGSCYDPAYQAGYPKTPVFDGGSRPSEFVQIIGGTSASAYKFGLAICCLCVPLAFVGMARGILLSPSASCTAGLLGCALWWSPPSRALIDAGDFDLLLGGLCALLHVCWLIRFERMPGIDSWLVMTVFVALAWWMQPFLMIGFFPFLLLFYLWVATRQNLIWHLAIASTLVVGFGVNYAWLSDWGRNLWLYLPFGGDQPAPAPTWPAIAREWTSLLPRDPVSIGVAVAGLVGLFVLLAVNRSAAWLLGLGTLVFTLGAGVGKVWPVLSDFGTEKLLIVAVWCLVCPAAHLFASIAEHLGKASGWRPVGLIWIVAALTGLAWSIDLPRQLSKPRGLEIGLNANRAAAVRTLVEQTTPDARILWEDRPGSAHGWTALLASLTDRWFLGGLDSDGRVEHMFARLHGGKLCGKPIGEWSDAQLVKFCERYNIGWVVCFEPESIERFRALPFAKPIAEIKDGSTGVLFALERKFSYFLKGRGKLVQADWQRLALADVEPENGEVILCIHYQTNLRTAPAYVQAERDLDLDDPIPLLRLKVPGPVTRLTIVWENP
jgi:hypothetical protein